MASRLPVRLPVRLATDTTTSRMPQICTSRHFSSSPVSEGRRDKKKERPQFRDSFTIKQAEKRRQAHKARDLITIRNKVEAAGSPMRGTAETTSFVKSFDTAIDPDLNAVANAAREEALRQATSSTTNVVSQLGTGRASKKTAERKLDSAQPVIALAGQLNHFFTADELRAELLASKKLSAPYSSLDRNTVDINKESKAADIHQNNHAIRQEAVSRILAAENASSDQKTRINTQRCIERFGRHNTDTVFKPRELSPWQQERAVDSINKRAGVDTGSSEVQIAILTAKIRVLADQFEGVSKNDKINKRNLRVLLHKRQKLLKYFEKKDRGGDRWHHLVETLGLTTACWRGEIVVQ